MHVKVFNVCSVWLAIILSAKPSKAFISQVSINWVDTFDQYIESAIKFLAVNHKRVLDISLNQEFVMKCALWQVSELFKKNNSIPSSTFRGFCDECLVRELPIMVLEVP